MDIVKVCKIYHKNAYSYIYDKNDYMYGILDTKTEKEGERQSNLVTYVGDNGKTTLGFILRRFSDNEIIEREIWYMYRKQLKVFKSLPCNLYNFQLEDPSTQTTKLGVSR